MGVRGLTSFFNQNPSLSKTHKLHNTKVIIDGNNILHQLYFNQKVDCVCGGDYNKFADVVKKYFTKFLDCDITPIVLFDGCHDKSDRKLSTCLNRMNQRLMNARNIAGCGTYFGRVLPILALDVMKDVLDSIGITHAQSDYEADDHITALANYYHCPVISQDSDFYIFDIVCGFIRFDTVDSTPKEETSEDGLSYKYLKCQIYFVDKFLSSFPGIDKHVLPLFGTLIGNDYVRVETFDNFFANIQLPKCKHKLKVNPRHRKMIGLLAWLKHHSLDDAIKQVLNHLKMKNRDHVRSIIEQAVSGYEVHHYTPDTHTIESATHVPFLGGKSPTTFCGTPLPEWFVQKSRIGDVPPQLLSVVALRRIFLQTQVEDMSSPSSFSCSAFIRQILYGILLSHDKTDQNHCPDSDQVREYDHCCGKLKKSSVTPVFSINGFGAVPTLNELNAIDSNHTKSLVVKVIGDNTEYFSSLPEVYQLLIGCIRFWLRNCIPKPSMAFLYGLIVNVMYFSIAQNSLFHSDATLAKICDLDDIIPNITQPELDFFTENMKKYHQKPQHNNANPFNISIVHSFSQLQTCILFMQHLNCLIGSPFTKMKVQCFFNGTVLYNLVRDLLSRPFPELFLSELLGRSSTVSSLFTELKSKILEHIPNDCVVVVAQVPCKRKRKAKSKGSVENSNRNEASVENEDITSLCNKFTLLGSTVELDENVDVLL